MDCCVLRNIKNKCLLLINLTADRLLPLQHLFSFVEQNAKITVLRKTHIAKKSNNTSVINKLDPLSVFIL